MNKWGVFELLWDEEVVGVLVERTNMWKVIPGEMRVFLALVIYMGAKRDFSSKSFWKE